MLHMFSRFDLENWFQEKVGTSISQPLKLSVFVLLIPRRKFLSSFDIVMATAFDMQNKPIFSLMEIDIFPVFSSMQLEKVATSLYCTIILD